MADKSYWCWIKDEWIDQYNAKVCAMLLPTLILFMLFLITLISHIFLSSVWWVVFKKSWLLWKQKTNFSVSRRCCVLLSEQYPKTDLRNMYVLFSLVEICEHFHFGVMYKCFFAVAFGCAFVLCLQILLVDILSFIFSKLKCLYSFCLCRIILMAVHSVSRRSEIYYTIRSITMYVLCYCFNI